jgi:hypothetical protein
VINAIVRNAQMISAGMTAGAGPIRIRQVLPVAKDFAFEKFYLLIVQS